MAGIFKEVTFGFVLFLWYWGLNPRLPVCQARTPPLSGTASPSYSEAGSCEAAQAGLDLGILLESQVCATAAGLFLDSKGGTSGL